MEVCYSFEPKLAVIVEDRSWMHLTDMEITPKTTPAAQKAAAPFYCPVCAVAVGDPLTCGDCLAVICRRCGTPLESSDELGMG